MTSSDAADRCVHIACAKTTGVQTLMVEEANTDILIEEEANGTHLKVGTLTTTTAKAIVAELQKQPAAPIIIHLAPSNSDGACHLDLKSEYELVACLSCCEVPLVTVCEDGVLVNAARCLLMAVADVVIVSESAKVSMSSLGQSTFDFRRKVWATHRQHRVTQEDLDTHPVGAQAASQAGLVDIIAPVHGLKQELDLVLRRFKKVGNPLLRACKTQLPAVSLNVAALAMARLTVPTPMDTDGDLARLTLSEDGLATVELNNPVHFNNQSPKLMADLALRLREVNRYAVVGKVNAMVLQGAGPHFCTGGWNPEGSEEKPTSWSENMVMISSTSETAAMIRRLPVPTFSAVHGKLIGGGVALALATDFIICSEGATFNFGNLPRGMSPLFMLSRSMSLAVGHGLANQSYLEDPVLTAEDVVAMGLAHEIAGSANEAKQQSLLNGSAAQVALHGDGLASVLNLQKARPNSQTGSRKRIKNAEMRVILDMCLNLPQVKAHIGELMVAHTYGLGNAGDAPSRNETDRVLSLCAALNIRPRQLKVNLSVVAFVKQAAEQIRTLSLRERQLHPGPWTQRQGWTPNAVHKITTTFTSAADAQPGLPFLYSFLPSSLP